MRIETIKADMRREMGAPAPSKLKIYALVDLLASEQQQQDPFVGSWNLVYTDDDKTRASPFFWAFQKAFGDKKVPMDVLGAGNIADSVFKITDAIPSSLKKIGSVKQYAQAGGKFISQVEIVSPIGSSFMTTTSRWLPDPKAPGTVELRVEKTQVLQSTIQQLLGISSSNPLLAAGFPSGAALELASPGSSSVTLTNLFLDETLRVSRNEGDRIFIFERISGDEQPVGL